jgi:hypothetical protein
MPPFSPDHAVISPSSKPTRLAIESIYTILSPGPVIQRTRSNSQSIISAVSHKEFPIAPIPERAVWFHPYMEVIFIADLDTYTEEEIKACWYTEDEFESVQDANRRSIQRISSGLRNPEEDSLRGLESQMHAGVYRSKKIKQTSIVAVLSEQYKQRQLKKCNPLLLQQSYSFFTGYAATRAVELAREDASEALRIQQDSFSLSLNRGSVSRKCWLFDPSFWFPRIVENALIVDERI